MDVESVFLHDRIEAVVSVSRIIYGPDRPVRLDEAVLTFDVVPISVFPLTLYVARVQVFDTVVEQIIWMCLQQKTNDTL